MNRKQKGMIFAVLSGICWGFYGIFSTMLINLGIDETYLTLLAPMVLFIYYFFIVMKKIEELKKVPLKHIVTIMVLLGLCNFGNNTSYMNAYANGMPTGIVASVAFCNVIVIFIESYFLFRYKITFAKAISALLSLLGIMLVLGVFGGGVIELNDSGIFWTILIPFFFGTVMVINKYYILKGIDADVIMLLLSMGSFTICLFTLQINPLLMVENIYSVATNNSQVWFWLLGFCLVPQIMCYCLMQSAMKIIEPSIFSISYAVDPMIASIMGVLVFSQTISFVQLIGIAFILSAVCYLNYVEGKSEKNLGLNDEALG